MEPLAEDPRWEALNRLQGQTNELSRLEVASIKTRVGKQLTSLTDNVDKPIRPSPFLLESRISEDRLMYQALEQVGDSDNPEGGEEEGEEEDGEGSDHSDEDGDGRDYYEVDYDLSIFQGDGEIDIGGELIRVADWLGPEYTDRINVTPILTVPGLVTELKEWQRHGAAKIRECVTGPNRGCILGDDMRLGKTLTTITACLMTRNEVAGAFDLVVTTTSCAPQWHAEIIDHFEKVRLSR